MHASDEFYSVYVGTNNTRRYANKGVAQKLIQKIAKTN